MPAVSSSQQRLFGMVHAYQRGKLKHAPAKIKQVAKHIDKTDATHFAATKHKGLPEHVKEAMQNPTIDNTTEFLAGVVRYCVENQFDASTTHYIVKEAGAKFLTKEAAGSMPSIPGGPNIGDPTHWGVSPGQKPGQQGQGAQSAAAGQEQQDLNTAQSAVNKQTPPSQVKNTGGIAPMPHRYRFDLDETVLRIKRDQIAYAQKQSREAQKAQHVTGVGPSAQGQTGTAQEVAPQIAQQHQQQGQQVQAQAQGT